MEKLDVEKAKKFCEETLIKLPNKENAEFIILHSRLVSEVSLILAEHKNVDKKVLEIAGWVHDVGKIISDENHPKHSVEILEKRFELDKKLRDCIINHSTSSNPETEEGKIFKVADKAALLHPDIVKNLINCSEERYKKGVSFVRKIGARIPDLLENYKR